MEKRYNVYFAGEILEGFEAGQVRAGLAALFKADEATLQKLFSASRGDVPSKSPLSFVIFWVRMFSILA